MFSKLFRKTRSIDELIFDIAEHQRAADYDEFYTRMRTHDFYTPIEGAPPGPSGMKIRSDGSIRVPFVELEGAKMGLFYTDRGHPALGTTFGGMDGVEVLRHTVSSREIEGVVFQNAASSWIGLDKDKCRHLLELA